jgi:YVTN family beta-propeller protein
LGGFSKPFSLTDSRHLQLTLGPGDLAVAGQYSLGVKNPSAPAPARSALNLTSQPVFSMPSTSIIPGFNQPVAIALNKATGVPVVVNQGNNTLAVLDPAFTTITANVPVGTKPTSVAVDSVRNLAFVTDNGSSAVDVVDLSGPTIAATLSCVGNAPVAVGVDEIHGRAIVVDQNTSAATILDTTPPLTCPTMTSPGSVLGTVNISTGANPQVAVDPELGWAIITPGGGGTLSVVDLVRQAVVFRVIVSAGIQGVAVNHETKELLLVDSTLATATLFSLLDQTTASLTLQLGNVAAAINPLTNVGLSVNPTTHQAFVVDLASPSLQGTVTVGTNPVAVTLDAATNKALVADATDNTVTVISLGPTRCTLGDPQILDVNPPAILTTGAAVPLTITGAGFSAGSQVRLDESLVSTTFVNSRTMMATVPVSFLTGPRRVVVEVRNPSGAISNASNLLVVQPVSVGNSPQGVAIDVNLDLGVVTNAGDGTVSIVDLTTGTVNSTISLGSSNTTVPQGVAVISRADRAVVANSGNSTAAIIDLTTNTAIGPISAGGQPAGVGISEDSGQAVVANSTTNTISEFSALATSAPVPSATTLDPQPIAVAVAPELNLAAITHGTANDVITVDISTGTPFFTHRIIGSQLPTGIAYDPDTQQFLVASSLTNLVQAINPQALTAFTLGVGVNPTALAYDYQIGELLTLNTASNTVTVVDFQSRRARDVFSFSGSPRFSVAIHSRLGIAVVADGPNNRVLLVPLPR